MPVSSCILTLVSRYELSGATSAYCHTPCRAPHVMAMDFNLLENCEADNCFLLETALVMAFCHQNSKNELRQKLVQFRPGWR